MPGHAHDDPGIQVAARSPVLGRRRRAHRPRRHHLERDGLERLVDQTVDAERGVPHVLLPDHQPGPERGPLPGRSTLATRRPTIRPATARRGPRRRDLRLQVQPTGVSAQQAALRLGVERHRRLLHRPRVPARATTRRRSPAARAPRRPTTCSPTPTGPASRAGPIPVARPGTPVRRRRTWRVGTTTSARRTPARRARPFGTTRARSPRSSTRSARVSWPGGDGDADLNDRIGSVVGGAASATARRPAPSASCAARRPRRVRSAATRSSSARRSPRRARTPTSRRSPTGPPPERTTTSWSTDNTALRLPQATTTANFSNLAWVKPVTGGTYGTVATSGTYRSSTSSARTSVTKSRSWVRQRSVDGVLVRYGLGGQELHARVDGQLRQPPTPGRTSRPSTTARRCTST